MFIAQPHVQKSPKLTRHLLNNVKLNSSSAIVTVNIYWSLQKFSSKGCVLCGLTRFLQKGNQQLNNWTELENIWSQCQNDQKTVSLS